MAQTIERPIKVYNGIDWDKVYPETSERMVKGLLRNTEFYRTTDLVNAPSENVLQWQKQTGDTDLIKWDTSKSGEFLVGESGLYLIRCKHVLKSTGSHATLQLRDFTNGEKMIGDTIVNMGIVNGINNIQYLAFNSLKSGDKIKFTTYWTGTMNTFMTSGCKLEFLRIGDF